MGLWHYILFYDKYFAYKDSTRFGGLQSGSFERLVCDALEVGPDQIGFSIEIHPNGL